MTSASAVSRGRDREDDGVLQRRAYEQFTSYYFVWSSALSLNTNVKLQRCYSSQASLCRPLPAGSPALELEGQPRPILATTAPIDDKAGQWCPALKGNLTWPFFRSRWGFSMWSWASSTSQQRYHDPLEVLR